MTPRTEPQRADPHNSPPLAPSSPEADHTARLRSRSIIDKLGDKLNLSISELKGRKPSPSPENIRVEIARAGLIIGATGSDYAVTQSVREINDGAQAFLGALERATSSAQTRFRGTATRVNSDQITTTIQVQEVSGAANAHHPIIDVDKNPFDPSDESGDEPTSPTDSIEANEYFIKDIAVPHHDKDKLFMRARLDSGMRDNAISEEKALETGFEIEKYTGPDMIVGNGATFTPVGKIRMQFHFRTFQAAKTWTVPFMVFPHPPFDVAFGRIFIVKANLLATPAHETLPGEYKKYTPKEEAERQKRTTQRANESSSKQSSLDNERYEKRWAKKKGSSNSSPAPNSSASSYKKSSGGHYSGK